MTIYTDATYREDDLLKSTNRTVNYSSDDVVLPNREDLEGVPGAFLVHNLLTPDECAQYIHISEGMRGGERRGGEGRGEERRGEEGRGGERRGEEGRGGERRGEKRRRLVRKTEERGERTRRRRESDVRLFLQCSYIFLFLSSSSSEQKWDTPKHLSATWTL